jgi:hypothetical protein
MIAVYSRNKELTIPFLHFSACSVLRNIGFDIRGMWELII